MTFKTFDGNVVQEDKEIKEIRKEHFKELNVEKVDEDEERRQIRIVENIFSTSYYECDFVRIIHTTSWHSGEIFTLTMSKFHS